MLLELAVRNLGVIEEARVVLQPGLTALTGETGAGKTLITEAVLLLIGGRSDPALVRTGAIEAEVEGRFLCPGGEGDEIVIRRVVPRDGRSRAYVDGRLATVSAVADAVADLLELHGQHGHQLLLRPPARRAALDRFGNIDAGPLREARLAVRTARSQREELGGDSRARAREIELLSFQLDELDNAHIAGPDEDELLIAEERLLADSTGHRESAIGAGSILGTDGVVGDGLARALGLIKSRDPFAAQAERLQALILETNELASELRADAEVIPDDPVRLVAVGERRRVLTELRRKYGATLEEVLAYGDECRERLELLRSYDERAQALEAEIAAFEKIEQEAGAELAAKRRKAAPKLAKAVQERLASLALPDASVEITVGEDPGDLVDFLVSMNPGLAPGPLAKVASGGELSRVMLALQLVVAEAPPTMIFDEVDAGVGGQAATAVGRALAEVAEGRQVLVVTHLPQVAAFAHHHIHIAKAVQPATGGSSGSTPGAVRTTLEPLADSERIIELSRMLSGSPDSQTARVHAAELLAEAAKA